MYAAHWAAPRGRYTFKDDVAELGLSEVTGVLERREMALAGRTVKENVRRRKDFLDEARDGDFWRSSKSMKP
jgi:hypothetical protein